MKNIIVFLLFVLFSINSCNSKADKSKAFIPDSSGNLNHISVIMPTSDWKGQLGKSVRDNLSKAYEGLPFDEPQFSLDYLNPKVFSGFARQSRNIIWFQKDSIPRFQLANDQFSRPQIVGLVTGEDSEVQQFFFEENLALFTQTISENERKEKLRRINKSPTKDKNLKRRFGYNLVYPSVYKVVKDTSNFIWIQKQIQKGHLNIIAYEIFDSISVNNFNTKILNIRDSIGKLYIPGRISGSYMITERAYQPYFYKVELDGKKGYLTKGTWEVANDFMAGPFVNYMIKDSLTKNWMVIEGFTFAPSMNKRDYMFELNTIITTIKKVN